MTRFVLSYRSLPVGLLACAVTTLLIGCGEGGPQLVPVAGIVTLEGGPLAGAGVAFHPDKARGNTADYLPAGTADADGAYELITATKKGAPEGWYTVVITAPVPPRVGGEAPKVGPPPFDVKYTDVAKSDLSLEVKAGADLGTYDLNLTK